MTASIALVDDHILLRKGLCSLINSFDEFDILFEADNGKDFISKLKPGTLPGVVLMDINMPQMDGYETALWIKNHFPDIRVLALSMYDNENAIIRMFKAGAKGYILKDCDPADLKEALHAVSTKGFYYSETITGRLIRNISQDTVQLSELETEFLKLVCTEMTYKEIADQMCKSPRTIDGYRDDLFKKLNVKTRVGLVMYAIRHGIVRL